MKKLVSVFLLFTVLCSIVLTSCKSYIYERISLNDEQYKKIDENGVKDIDFTDCTVDYISGGCFDVDIFESMSSGNKDEFIKCLQNASLEKTDDYVTADGGIGSGFRITLNSEEVIYICYDEYCNPGIVDINSMHFKCDEDSIKIIKGKMRYYRSQPDGHWYYM